MTVHKTACTATGANPRSKRRGRKTLMAAVRGQNGAIDLASIMVGVLVIGIIGGVVAATVFAVVPWSQDEAAKGDLGAVATAESVFKVGHAGYGSLDELQAPSSFAAGGGSPRQPAASVTAEGRPLLPAGGNLAVSNNAGGYIIASTSVTGHVFWQTSLSSKVSDTLPTVLPDGLTAPVPRTTSGEEAQASPPADPTAAWNIPDPALRALVLGNLGLSADHSLTLGDAWSLTGLRYVYVPGGPDIVPTAIASLEGIQFASNLTTANFNWSQITDLTPLAGLHKLVDLDVSQAQITTIAPLAKIQSLTRLTILTNSISDLTPLAGLRNLTFLDFSWTSVTDLTPISGMTSLQEVRLNGNSVTDISSVAGLTGLTDLAFDHTGVSDISPLANLHLSTLDISWTPVTDLSPLANDTTLNMIFADGLGMVNLVQVTTIEWSPVAHIAYVSRYIAMER